LRGHKFYINDNNVGNYVKERFSPPSLFRRIKGVKDCEVSAGHGDSAAWEIPGFENGNKRVDKKGRAQ
jgi:hypothetical protein